jgi:hypothetical protein
VKTRIRRRIRRPPDLTSLFDVLFIVVFVALIRAAAAEHAVDEATKPRPPPTEPPPPPVPVAALKVRALATISADLAKRTPLVVRVSERGVVAMLESADQKVTLDVPLLEESTDVDVQTSYLGARSADLRICRVAAVNLHVPDLSSYLVIIAPERPRRQRQIALNEGLDRDIVNCLTEQNGTATIVEPEVAP